MPVIGGEGAEVHVEVDVVVVLRMVRMRAVPVVLIQYSVKWT